MPPAPKASWRWSDGGPPAAKRFRPAQRVPPAEPLRAAQPVPPTQPLRPLPPPEPLRQAALLLLGGATAGQAARAAGYPGTPALERALRRHYGVESAAWRGWRRSGGYPLAYGGAFHLRETLRYLGRDPANQAERVQGESYTRYFPPGAASGAEISAGAEPVLVTLRLGPRGCVVTAAQPAAPQQALALHAQVRRFLGLEQPLAAFYRLVGPHPALGGLLPPLRGVRIPQLPSLWEAVCWAVVGQQINLAFAYRLRNRLIALGNGVEETPGQLLPFPSPGQVLRLTEAQLRRQQFSRQKAAYLLGLAQACASGALAGIVPGMAPGAAPWEEVEATLLAQKGLGPWSVAYALMRGLGHADALPVGDTGLRTALQRRFGLSEAPGIAQQRTLMEPFRPFRSLATYYLWKSLSSDRVD